jgi:MFS family permease
MSKGSIRIDLSPLREFPDFRRLWTSSLITRFGSMVTYVAAPFQIKEITGSFVAVGILGVVEIIPLIIFGLYGGALADRLDRKRIVVLCEFGFTLTVLALAFNSTMQHPSIWVIYVVAMLTAALDGLQRPSLDAMLPRLVPMNKLGAANALGSLTHSVSFVFGTALAGVVITRIGFTRSYLLDVASFVISIALLARLPRIAATNDDAEHQKPMQAIAEGTRYAWSRKDLLGTYLIDTAAMLFAYPVALFPFLADALDSPQSLGLLYSAGAVGAALATLTSGWTMRIKRHGVAVIIAATIWGIGIAIVGLVDTLPLALVGLAIAGAADMVSGLFRSLIWNTSIPDHLRGRMAGIELLSYSIGPQVGQVRASLSADMFGLKRAFVSGGILCVVSVNALGSVLPALRNYRAPLDEQTQSAVVQ